jgi:uncharacterized protein (DUF1800 family)
MNRADTAHFLRRVGFGATWDQMDALAALTKDQLVDQYMNLSGAQAANEPTSLTQSTTSTRSVQDMGRWWINRMLTNPAPLQEKMTLFWHGLWVSALEDDINNGMIYRQNQTWRTNCLTTNLEPFMQAMAVDPAMLLYLDNASNRKGRANENFARELFELFGLGVVDRYGNANYSEFDITECARAWTGYGLGTSTPSPDSRIHFFNPSNHDTGSKTIFGNAAAWNGPGVITNLLCGTASGNKRDKMAYYIARRVFEYFAYPGASADTIQTHADAFVTSGLSVHALVRSVLMSDAFWSTTARQGLVRPPIDWMVDVLRALNLDASRYTTGNADWMGQVIFDPPDVSGWRQNAYWINPTAWWGRANFLGQCFNGLGGTSTAPTGMLSNTSTLAVTAAVDQALNRFGVDRDAGLRNRLITWLTGERAANANAQSQQRNLITQIAMSAEFALA